MKQRSVKGRCDGCLFDNVILLSNMFFPLYKMFKYFLFFCIPYIFFFFFIQFRKRLQNNKVSTLQIEITALMSEIACVNNLPNIIKLKRKKKTKKIKTKKGGWGNLKDKKKIQI